MNLMAGASSYVNVTLLEGSRMDSLQYEIGIDAAEKRVLQLLESPSWQLEKEKASETRLRLPGILACLEAAL